MSINEFSYNDRLESNVNEIMVKGGYPRIYTDNFSPDELYPSYIQTYVERDVRLLTHVENLSTFKKFVNNSALKYGAYSHP